MIVENEIFNVLNDCRNYIIKKGINGEIIYRSENSNLLRIAESESFFEIELQDGKQIASGNYTGKISNANQLFNVIDSIYASLKYMPALPYLQDYFPIEKSASEPNAVFDEYCGNIISDSQKDIFKNCIEYFDNAHVKISGILTSGISSYIIINTLSENFAYCKFSDYNIKQIISFSNKELLREISVEHISEKAENLIEKKLYNDLKLYYNIYSNAEPADIVSGEYDVIFSAAAMSELLYILIHLTLSGERIELGLSMLKKKKHKFGDKIFNDNFTLIDDIENKNILFKKKYGLNGMQRKSNILFERGVFSYTYYSDRKLANKFGNLINNDLRAISLKMKCGECPYSLETIRASAINKTLLINGLHYMNITNTTNGSITCSARFGSFIIENNEIRPLNNNIRISDSLFKIFNNIEWISSEYANINTADTYGMRLPSAIQSPLFTKINDVCIFKI